MWVPQKPSHCSESDLLPLPNDGSCAAALFPIRRLWKRLYSDESRGGEQQDVQSTTKDSTTAEFCIINCVHGLLDLHNLGIICTEQRYERGVFRGWKLGCSEKAHSRTLASGKVGASNWNLYRATASCQLDVVRSNCVIGNICTACAASTVTTNGKRQWPSERCGKKPGTVGTAGYTSPSTYEWHI